MKNFTKNTGHIGMTTISTANSNLDGTGATGEVIVATEQMHIGLVIIKATGDTSQGVVRLFIEDTGTDKRLIQEIEISGNEQTSVLPAYQAAVFVNIHIPKNYKLLASTENAEEFNVIAGGHYWTQGSAADKIVETARFGNASISTANGNLNGGGALGTVISGSDNGLVLPEIDIKAIGSTEQGMIRLFLDDGSNTKLFWEESVPAVTQDSVTAGFQFTTQFGMVLPNSWSVKASTQVADSFKVIASGNSWAYAEV